MASTYYNEIDPFAASWLRILIKQGHLPHGDIDRRPIQEIDPNDLTDYVACHFFAGIGGWAYALALAEWPTSRPVWTGSCPCQPFSSAGGQYGFDDPRHLWPHWKRLIEKRHPPTIFGEQVASRAARSWWDVVATDLEGMAYAVGAADLGAPCVEAPHLRQRLWFVADTGRESKGRRLYEPIEGVGANSESSTDESGRPGDPSSAVADASRERCDRERLRLQRRGPRQASVEARRRGEVGQLGNPSRARLQRTGRQSSAANLDERGRQSLLPDHPWHRCDWISCIDGKSRPVEPGTFPLAHGVPNRVGRLRGYGNAIVPQVAEVFIRAYLEIGRGR